MFRDITEKFYKSWMFIFVVFNLVVTASIVSAEEKINTAPFGVIELEQAIADLPLASQKIIQDKRLLDSENKGIRVFRLYKPVPPHYHEKSDTILYLLEGEASFVIDQAAPKRVKAGSVLYWQRGVIHAVTEIHTETATFLAIDVPKRDPADAVFIDQKDVEFLH